MARSKPELHPRVVAWGSKYSGSQYSCAANVDATGLRLQFDHELKEYFRLSGLSRSSSARPEYVQVALDQVFRVRVLLERSLISTIGRSSASFDSKVSAVLANSFYGFSKKQGTSLRMPLSTCQPTALCAGACYAHDVLDAAPGSIVRGAMNGWLAEQFERGGDVIRTEIIRRLELHSRRAIRSAFGELKLLPSGYKRRAYIRFSHVGEIVAFPGFANALARQVIELSEGKVDCVVYTRHRNAALLDPKLWIINFTLDERSLNRKAWVPPHARIVYSAFGGRISPLAEVNFLEHHRHSHSPKTAGEGRICPATLPETEVRSCDACCCNRCFVPPKPAG